MGAVQLEGVYHNTIVSPTSSKSFSNAVNHDTIDTLTPTSVVHANHISRGIESIRPVYFIKS